MSVVLGIILFFVNIFMRGLTLAILWSWFVVPLGVPDIRILHALGIGLMVNVFLIRMETKKSDEDASAVALLIKAIAVYAMVIGLGALFHWGMI